MSEEVKETASTATNDKIAAKDPNLPTDFSLDNLKLQFEECLNDDNTISIEKYIFGMSTYIFKKKMLVLHVTNFRTRSFRVLHFKIPDPWIHCSNSKRSCNIRGFLTKKPVEQKQCFLHNTLNFIVFV